MPFNRSTAASAGRKGGQSRTHRKQRAARKNGKRGGRRFSRTLLERLLGRKLTEEHQQVIKKAWSGNKFLLIGEQNTLFEFFGLTYYQRDTALDLRTFQRKTGRMSREIRYLVAKFRLSANYILDQYQAKPVKDYVVVTRQATREEIWAWEQRHPGLDIPCPPHRHKQVFRYMPDFGWIKLAFQGNPDMTVQELEEWAGGRYSGKGVIEGLHKYLLSLTKKQPPNNA